MPITSAGDQSGDRPNIDYIDIGQIRAASILVDDQLCFLYTTMSENLNDGAINLGYNTSSYII